MADTNGIIHLQEPVVELPLETQSMVTFNVEDNVSDYGDLGEDEAERSLIENLLEQIEAEQLGEDRTLEVTDIEDYEAPRGLHLPKVLGFEGTRQWQTQTELEGYTQVLRDQEVTGAETKNASNTGKSTLLESLVGAHQIETQPAEPDTRSPLERFRRPPKKSLSVTDLVSPAWCELQYFYTLSKHGRKRRTPAMKQGTKVHQALEMEVHVTVPIEVTKKVDSWGLRVWNIIQGLRTLRDTGRTRELEVWGTIGGEIVNGVIDEVSYECPDPKLEALSEESNVKTNAETGVPELQATITDYLVSTKAQEDGRSVTDALTPGSGNGETAGLHDKIKQRKIYITDVKTRTTPTIPTGSSIRPTIVQLHLYHHMLENLAQGNFSLSLLTERYGLDADEMFSDSFIAQVGSLNQESYLQSGSQEEPSFSQILSSDTSMEVILENNNLRRLWDHMLQQFRITFLFPDLADEPPTPTPQSVADIPPPASNPTRLSRILTAEYLAPNYKHQAGAEKRSIGKKSIVFNAGFLKSYLNNSLSWWRGERDAKGVELGEAWKCRSCDFRDDCEWIHERDAAAVQEAMERKKMREVAGVEGKGLSKSKV